jgi:hypothetical protein
MLNSMEDTTSGSGTGSQDGGDFSVIIPWRTDNGPRERVFQWILDRWCALYETHNVEILYGDAGGEVFSRSRTRNELAARSTKEVLVFADADTAPIPKYLNEACERARQGTWTIAYDNQEYYNMTEKATEFLLGNSPSGSLVRPFGDAYDHRLTAWAGMLAVPREAFNRIDGYDERFVGWGHEDVAFRLKLDNEWGEHARVRDGFVMHLWHPREDATFDTELELKNRELFDREYRRKYRWRDERL